MEAEIRIGLIGFGWMGQAHSRSYRNIPVYFAEAGIRPRLVVVADTDAARRSLAIENFGYESAVEDWRAVVERGDLDVIDITAPTALHETLAIAALATGRPVFCEKPVGMEPRATEAIAAAARTAGAITGAGYNYRWAPLVRYTKGLADAGRFGVLTHYRGRFFNMYGRDRLGQLSWRYLADQAGYGALTDLMCHATDMALHLAGPIRRVVAVRETFVSERPLPRPGTGTHYERGRPDDPRGAVTNEDYVGALVEFASGVRGTLEADRAIFGPQSSMAFELNGSRGAAAWDHEKLNQLRLYLADEQPNDGFIEVLAGDAFPRQGNIVPGGGNSLGYEDLKVIEAVEFLTAVREGRPFEPGFEAAARVAAVLDAMIRSWSTERWEDVRPLTVGATG
jgi:predicted dehydrogenase